MFKKNSHNLFLLELIFSIFFFIIVATICLQVFSKAHFYNVKTNNLNKSTEIIQNEIELFYSTSYENESNSSTFFNSDWKPTNDVSTATYVLEKKYSTDSSFKYLDLLISELNTDSIIYKESVRYFIYK